MIEGLTRNDRHEYFFRGRRKPGVSEIITDNRLVDRSGPWYTQRHREMGVVLHDCCALIAEGRLDWNSVDPRVLREAQAFEELYRRLAAAGRPLVIMGMLYSERYGFAGEPDLALVFCADTHDTVSVIDIKRGVADPVATPLQTAGYGLLISETCRVPEKLIDRYAMHGFSGGEPRLVKYSDPDDYAAFLAALTIRNWLANH